MELGPQNHNGDGLLGANSIIVVYMDPLGQDAFQPDPPKQLLGGSWVVINGVISPPIWVIIISIIGYPTSNCTYNYS